MRRDSMSDTLCLYRPGYRMSIDDMRREFTHGPGSQEFNQERIVRCDLIADHVFWNHDAYDWLVCIVDGEIRILSEREEKDFLRDPEKAVKLLPEMIRIYRGYRSDRYLWSLDDNGELPRIKTYLSCSIINV
jgi:hypothetical protein